MNDDLSNHARKFAPEYGKHDFSDHLPMAVTALRNIGAGDDRVKDFAKNYSKKLRRKKPGAASIDPALLSISMGDPAIYPKALNFFYNEILNEGRAEVLAQYLPELTKCITAAAFHGVIRTAYGLLANENLEIAAGLAYWWAHAQPISFGLSIGAANNNAGTLIDDVADAFRKHGKKLNLDQPTISARLREVTSNTKIAGVLSRAAAAKVSFDEIAAASLQMYLAAQDFTALHCVTGVHAARILADHVVMNDRDLRAALWAGTCAAYASIGAPPLASLTPAPTSGNTWKVITSAAISSDDEHDIKFVFSCREEARRYGRDAQYRCAAGVRLGLSVI